MDLTLGIFCDIGSPPHGQDFSKDISLAEIAGEGIVINGIALLISPGLDFGKIDLKSVV